MSVYVAGYQYCIVFSQVFRSGKRAASRQNFQYIILEYSGSVPSNQANKFSIISLIYLSSLQFLWILIEPDQVLPLKVMEGAQARMQIRPHVPQLTSAFPPFLCADAHQSSKALQYQDSPTCTIAFPSWREERNAPSTVCVFGHLLTQISLPWRNVTLLPYTPSKTKP